MNKRFENESFVGRNLRGARFFGVTFVGCNFSGTDCTEAIFGDARFEGCNFEGARIFGATLSTAWFEKCNLRGVDLSEAKLGGARFHNATLGGANFSRAHAGKLEISDSTADASNWSECSLRGALFLDVLLNSATFRRTDLSWVRFSKCDLEGIDLHHSLLEHTRINGCRLRDVRGVPREPWDVRVSDAVDTSEAELLEWWLDHRIDENPNANPFPLGPASEDRGQVLSAILEGDPALEDVLLPGERIFPVLAPWFSRPRLYAVPTTNRERMIFVGLVGELHGEEDALLLEQRPQHLALIAKAAGVCIADAADAARYGRLAYHLASGAKSGAAWRQLGDVEPTPEGWRITAITQRNGRDARTIIDVTREGAVSIDE